MIRPHGHPLELERREVSDLRAWREELVEQVRLLCRHSLFLGLSPVYRANREAAVRILHARVDYISQLLARGLELVQEGEDGGD